MADEDRGILPTWFMVLGWLAAPGAWILMLRLVWEATVLTAREGGQMVGFALAHGSSAGILLCSMLLGLVWTLVAAVWIGVAMRKGYRASPWDWAELAVLGLPQVILPLVPTNT
jgi:hypothetical protein